MDIIKCKFCEGITKIIILKESNKATEPEVEFCPFCGSSITREKKYKELYDY
ncbi:MAG: hypothetical protein RAP70_04950 [Candidatus Celaenobacter antarcticus]|nr:hypothetical protein [Candidatus Celaenobacter antarcticus]